MLYAHILLFPPPLLFCKCCSCCKTMHQLHFQRLSTDLLKKVCLSNVGPLQDFYWQEKIIPRGVFCFFFKIFRGYSALVYSTVIEINSNLYLTRQVIKRKLLYSGGLAKGKASQVNVAIIVRAKTNSDMVTLDDKNLPRNRRTYKHQRKYSNLNFVVGHTTAGVTRISNKLTKCKKPNLKKTHQLCYCRW